MSRWLVAAGVMLAAVGISGCSGSAPQASDAPPSPASAPAGENHRIPTELRVPDPKTAAGIPPCELLTRRQLVDLGLDPDTADAETRGSADSCAWHYADRSSVAFVTMTVEPGSMNLAGLYATRETFAVFEPTTVAGHPAVRADDTGAGVCTLYVAVSDDQLVSADGNPLGRLDLPDPCAPSRRIAEFVLSNLPPKP